MVESKARPVFKWFLYDIQCVSGGAQHCGTVDNQYTVLTLSVGVFIPSFEVQPPREGGAL